MGAQGHIPPSVLRLLERAPTDRAVVLLLRHSVRDPLPSDDVGYSQAITDVGRQLAFKLGAIIKDRLGSLHASPLLRCVQTAWALADGAGVDMEVVENRLLGDPGVFVLNERRAWTNWEQLGHEGVMNHLVNETTALPGMARPDEAARLLVRSMFADAAGRFGVHVFVTHDSIVTPTAARLLGKPLDRDDWPDFLEGAFFWSVEDSVFAAYRDDEAISPRLLCSLVER